jgi:hypothetical protein
MQYPHQGNKQAFVEMHYLEVKSKIPYLHNFYKNYLHQDIAYALKLFC